MKRTLFFLAVLLVTVGFGVFGRMFYQSYTDVTSEPGYLDNFSVAEMSEERSENSSVELKQLLPQAPVILRVTALAEPEPEFDLYLYPFRIEQVYKGENLEVGDEIRVGRLEHRGLIIEREGGRYLEAGFVNVPKQGKEYLVFLSDYMVKDGSRLVGFFQEGEAIAPLPMFCYEDIPNTQVEVTGFSTYVSDRDVKDSEFFGTTPKSAAYWEELKAEMLQKYPR